MKKIFLSLLSCLILINVYAQGIGTWKAYPSYQVATKNIPVGNKIYSLCNGNLFSYNLTDEEVYCFDKINTLSDSKIIDIDYSKQAKRLILIYENGNIDLLDEQNNVLNLSHYKDKALMDKSINHLYIDGKCAYLSTNTGIIIIDMEEGVFANTYELAQKVSSSTANDQYIFVSTDKGIYKGKKTINLQDKGNWEIVNTKIYNEILFFNNTLLGYIQGNGLWSYNTQMIGTKIVNGTCEFRRVQDDKLITSNSSEIYIFNSLGDRKTIKQSNNFKYLTFHKNEFWASQGYDGLQAYKETAEGELQQTRGVIQPNSPLHDYFYYMKYVGDRLIVAGGNYNYFGKDYEGTAMYYENNIWTNFENSKIVSQKTGLPCINYTTIAQDPKDNNRHFVTSARQGMYEFKEGKFVKLHSYNNSSIASILPNDPNAKNYVSCSGATFDAQGNLWILNNQVDTVLKVMKPDGKWNRIYCSALEGSPTNDFIHFSRNGCVWVVSRRIGTRGIFCLDYNGTIENTKDDKSILRQEIINQDGVKSTPDEYYCMTEDHDGKIWIGTSKGPYVINYPDYFFDNNFYYEQIKIARNDGSNLADYLLNEIIVTSIAVDGGNRKWIGTQGNGVYLVSEDGQQMIHHFTEENSPILSNNVQSIAINGKTGEVMIGTEKGLVSYMSDAINPEYELNEDNIYAYPNPVEPDYNGPIVIKGLTQDCEVKIATTTGQVIYAGYSNGGMFTWYGRTIQGKKVSSGIYNVLTNTSDGKDCVVTKIAVIK